MGCSANLRNHLRTLIMTIAVFISTVALLPPEGVFSLDLHDPIQIIGNSNFTLENGVVNGNGTWNDPYVISGWEITSPGVGRAIYIENTTAHFRIENVFIHHTMVDAGIYVVESTNGTVVDSLLEDNAVAVCFAFSSNISISASNLANFEVGVRIWNSSGIRVSGLTFESGRRLLDIRGSSSVTVHDNTGDQGGLYIDGPLVKHFNTHEISTNNTVSGKPIRYFKDCSNLALDGSVAVQVIVANCSEIALANLSISGTEVAVELAFVRNAVVSSSILSQTWFGIYETLSWNITYQDVAISRASYKAAWVRYSNDTTFSECNILSSTNGIGFSYSHNSTVRRSSFSFDLRAGYGISSMYSSDILLEENRFQTMGVGFTHSRGDNLTILRNEFTDIREAIGMNMVNDSLVADNIAVDGHRMLDMIVANRISIMDNTAIDMELYAFDIWNTMNSSVERNRVDNASICGLDVQWSSSNTISGNSIMNSYIGICAFQSRNNTFFHNNIIDNTYQAYDWFASDNEWDNGYPSGGNYWSNYTGPDDFSGPNQDIPGSDGIRDLPFDFDPDTSDDYPLMSPVVTLPPDVPRNIGAELSGNGLENVTLSWNLSVDDLNGQRSVVGYDILRGTSYSSNRSGYLLHGSVSKGTSQYIDVGSGEGNPSNYFYVVCAVDSNGNSSCSREHAAKFTCPLSNGPNLLSIPLVQANESIEGVLQTVKYDKVWFYNSSSQEWEWFMTSKSYRRGLWTINHTMGLWVNVTGNSNLTVAGTVPAQTEIRLYEGWNLVSFPSFDTGLSVADLKIVTGAARVEGYDPAPPSFLRLLADGDALQAGCGYWLKVEVSVSWIVDSE